MFDAKFKLAAASLIRAAMVEDFDAAELIISQHDHQGSGVFRTYPALCDM
jgi:hypothetical protein